MHVAMVAGERSGDALGASLIRALRAGEGAEARLRVTAVAGPAMRASGCEVVADADRLAVMGLSEVLGHLPGLLRLRRQLAQRWRADAPQVLVGIDAPDFNLGLERRLREAGIRTVHYVSPSVWAWRRWRVRGIARAVDHMLTLFPFETAFYQDHGVAATCVGHPLADELAEQPDPGPARRALGLRDGPVVALLPGSRGSEYRRLAGLFLATARHLREGGVAAHFVVPLIDAGARAHLEQLLRVQGAGLSVTLLDGNARQAVAAADVVLLASGTATLETMLINRPMVVAYQVSPVTYGIARHLVRIRDFSLPNLLAGDRVVPEYIQAAATPQALAGAVRALLTEPARAHAQRAALRTLAASLRRGAARRAAAVVRAEAALCG